MQIKSILLALAITAFANAQNGTNGTNTTSPKAPKSTHVAVSPCVGDQTPLCCVQSATNGTVAVTNCINPGRNFSAKRFRATCAKSGRTAECCDGTGPGASGVGCQAV